MTAMDRPPIIRIHAGELVVDNFAGGGGTSTGIGWAIGRDPDIAINHDPEAIAMHKANHPNTEHYCESVWDVSPKKAVRGRPVALAWFSPDCKHFSNAKGGKPVDQKIRGLAWVAVRWARDVRPRVIMLENVREFMSWGPLLPNGKPDPKRKGETFQRWVGELRKLGYALEWRVLSARDFGAPTRRKRFFLIARNDSEAIVWPEPTHGPGRLPYRTSAECIDWSIPTRSIFGRSKPLAEKTMRRIAEGIKRYVLETPDPFIIPLTHHGDRRVHPLDEPMPTVTCAHRGELALIVPTLIQTGYGEREGQAPRALDLHQPLGTVVAGGAKHALVAAWLIQHYGDRGQDPGFLPGEPMGSVTTVDHHGLVTSHLVKLRGSVEHRRDSAQDLREAVPTITAGGLHLAEVRAFLVRYNKTGVGQALSDPLLTTTTRDRFGLVVIAGGEHAGEYVIADIGMRMLEPHELYAAQGFPPTYKIAIPFQSRKAKRPKTLSKSSQVRMCGNSVPPQFPEALVLANFAQGVTLASDKPARLPPNHVPVQQLSLFDALA